MTTLVVISLLLLAQDVISFRNNFEDNRITERSMPAALRNSIITGIKAMKYLLKDSRKVATNIAAEEDTHRMYIKTGGLGRMDKEFRKLVPNSRILKMPDGEFGRIGKVGYLFLYAKSVNKDGVPSISVFKNSDIAKIVAGKSNLKRSEVPHDEIMYKD